MLEDHQPDWVHVYPKKLWLERKIDCFFFDGVFYKLNSITSKQGFYMIDTKN